jgi:hypothetical protein
MEKSEQKKILFRFLKDRGIYRTFLRYIKVPAHANMQRKTDFPQTFNEYVEKRGVRYIITEMLHWASTKQGWSFWDNTHSAFLDVCNKYGIKDNR